MSGLGQLCSAVIVPAARPGETVAVIMRPLEARESDMLAEIANKRFQKNLAPIGAVAARKGSVRRHLW